MKKKWVWSTSADFDHLAEFALPGIFESHLSEDLLNPEDYVELEDKNYLQTMTSIPELCPLFRMESYHFVFYLEFTLEDDEVTQNVIDNAQNVYDRGEVRHQFTKIK